MCRRPDLKMNEVPPPSVGSPSEERDDGEKPSQRLGSRRRSALVTMIAIALGAMFTTPASADTKPAFENYHSQSVICESQTRLAARARASSLCSGALEAG